MLPTTCNLPHATQPMNETLTLSQHKLKDLLACRRRFQLRYLEQLPWPIEPMYNQAQETRDLGQRFHQILHRHFLGLPVDEDVTGDQQLRGWWQVFQKKGPQIPTGKLFPELSLTAPIGRHLLTGRFDLLVLREGQAQIFDWKTDSLRPPKAKLQEALQTRFYLALMAEGGSALKQAVEPGQISLNYWYVTAPEEMVTINYSQDQHLENWAYLKEPIAELDWLIAAGGEWPLTDDLSQCSQCAYQVYCGRIGDSLDLEEWELEDEGPTLEPLRP